MRCNAWKICEEMCRYDNAQLLTTNLREMYSNESIIRICCDAKEAEAGRFYCNIIVTITLSWAKTAIMQYYKSTVFYS